MILHLSSIKYEYYTIFLLFVDTLLRYNLQVTIFASV